MANGVKAFTISRLSYGKLIKFWVKINKYFLCVLYSYFLIPFLVFAYILFIEILTVSYILWYNLRLYFVRHSNRNWSMFRPFYTNRISVWFYSNFIVLSCKAFHFDMIRFIHRQSWYTICIIRVDGYRRKKRTWKSQISFFGKFLCVLLSLFKNAWNRFFFSFFFCLGYKFAGWGKYLWKTCFHCVRV